MIEYPRYTCVVKSILRHSFIIINDSTDAQTPRPDTYYGTLSPRSHERGKRCLCRWKGARRTFVYVNAMAVTRLRAAMLISNRLYQDPGAIVCV